MFPFMYKGSEGSSLIIHGVSSLFFFWSNLSHPVRLDLSAESAAIQQCFSLPTNQRNEQGISFSLGVLSSGSQQISEGWLLLQKMTSKYC
jgi:hypothetical protein